MKLNKLSDMVKGWFVGNFEPTLYKTTDVEVAVKRYKAGERDTKHYHKIATEISVILDGRAIMNGVEYSDGDIIMVEPNDVTEFEAIDDITIIVVKIPGAENDKYLV
jgi:quercetin dioxygenase-like cupin family protein